VYLSTFFTTPDFSFDDVYAIWNLVELAIGILAACLPTLRPLFAFILETATTALGTSRVRRGTGSYASGSGAPRHRYYLHDRDEGIKLSSIPSRSSISTGIPKNSDYGVGGVNITTVGLGTTGGHSVGSNSGRENPPMSGKGRGTVYGQYLGGQSGPSTGNEGRILGPMSRLEQSIGEDAGSSEENILPRGIPVETTKTYERGDVRKMGILKTTEVHVT
jgi:hypothetical protein